MIGLLVATSNRHKLQEIRDLLGEAGIEVTGLDDLATTLEPPEETGATFAENARLKALHYGALNPHGLTAAEDSGLVVDALDGEPGVRSARFVRPDASYAERFAEIYRRLDEHPDRPRTARFVCALAVARGSDIVYETTGVVEGEVTRPPRGTAGFGYDPIFFYPPYQCTLAEVTQASKLRVAHRGTALRAFVNWLARPGCAGGED
jgi:XTP/dITP diphosphohydrolase